MVSVVRGWPIIWEDIWTQSGRHPPFTVDWKHLRIFEVEPAPGVKVCSIIWWSGPTGVSIWRPVQTLLHTRYSIWQTLHQIFHLTDCCPPSSCDPTPNPKSENNHGSRWILNAKKGMSMRYVDDEMRLGDVVEYYPHCHIPPRALHWI